MPNGDSPEFLSAVALAKEDPLAVLQPSAKSPVSVVVADDHPVILEGLIKILNLQKDIRVVASAADGEEASKLYRRIRYYRGYLLVSPKQPSALRLSQRDSK